MFFPSSIQLEPIQVAPALNPLPLFINLFLIPALSVYLYYRALQKPFEPRLDLLFQYCIAASFNYVLTKMLILFPKRLFGFDPEMDSARYGLFALFTAFLLFLLFFFATKIKIAVDVTNVMEHSEGPQTKNRKNEEEFQHDERKQQ